MKTNNIIEEKSFNFAIRIVKLFKFLKNKNEHIISKQILRSGTSIGANVAEGLQGQSKKDFISKGSIALKETNETKYWIRLLMATDFLEKESGENILSDVEELIKILVTILKSSRANENDK